MKKNARPSTTKPVSRKLRADAAIYALAVAPFILILSASVNAVILESVWHFNYIRSLFIHPGQFTGLVVESLAVSAVFYSLYLRNESKLKKYTVRIALTAAIIVKFLSYFLTLLAMAIGDGLIPSQVIHTPIGEALLFMGFWMPYILVFFPARGLAGKLAGIKKI